LICLHLINVTLPCFLLIFGELLHRNISQRSSDFAMWRLNVIIFCKGTTFTNNTKVKQFILLLINIIAIIIDMNFNLLWYIQWIVGQFCNDSVASK